MSRSAINCRDRPLIHSRNLFIAVSILCSPARHSARRFPCFDASRTIPPDSQTIIDSVIVPKCHRTRWRNQKIQTITACNLVVFLSVFQMIKLSISQHDGILCSNLPSFQGRCDGKIRNLPQPLFVEYVKNTVRKVMLSAVAWREMVRRRNWRCNPRQLWV